MKLLRSYRPSTLLLLPLVALAISAAPIFETQLKDSEHGKIGKEVAAYFAAVEDNKGINEAFNDASEVINKSAKKLKGGPEILSLVDDWEAILAQATTTFHGHKDYKKKGKLVDEYKVTEGSRTIEGALLCPKSYNPRKGPALPLLLVIPDEKTDDLRRFYEENWAAALAEEPALIFVVKMPGNTRFWDVLQSPDGDAGGISKAMFALGHLQTVFKVDLDRVFIAGHGRGIGTAVATAAAFPQTFAGVVGRGAAPEGMRGANFGNIPSLFLSGGTHATTLQTALKELGFESCTVADGSENAVWEWFAGRERTPYPAKLHFEPTSEYMTSTNWLTLEGLSVDENPMVDASFDRSTNTITIDAQGIVKVHVYFNDEMADLDKPVKIMLNGVESEMKVSRNRRTMLDLARRSGDWGRVFVARHTFDVPVAADTGE